MPTNNYCIGLDIGLRKITCMVGEKEKNGMKINAVGESSAKGINRKGIITDNNLFKNSVREAIKQAEVIVGKTIRSSVLSLSGSYISVVNGVSNIDIQGKKITENDIKRAINVVKKNLTDKGYFNNKAVLKALPYKFIINGSEEVNNPNGLNADNLIVEINFIIADSRKISDIIQVMNSINIRIDNFIPGHYATGKGSIPNDIYNEIVGVIDFGAGMTKVSVFRFGKFEFMDTVYYGFDKINDDVASMCRTTFSDAERVKRSLSVELFLDRIDKSETISVKDTNGKLSRKISKLEFNKIVEARVEELFSLAINKMEQAPSFKKISNLVVTGGGANIKDFIPYLENIVGLPIILGIPKPIHSVDDKVENPMFTQPYGVLCVSCKNNYLDDGKRWQEIFKKMFK